MQPTPTARATDPKSPKTPRRLKTPEARQVHFEAGGKSLPYNISNSNPNNHNNNINAAPITSTSAPPATTATTGNPYGRISGITSANSPSGGFNVKVHQNFGKEPGPKTQQDQQQQEPVAPTSFPQVGLAPDSQLQWHTAANPTLSVSHQLPAAAAPSHFQAVQQPGQHFFPAAAPSLQPQLQPAAFTTTTTFIGASPLLQQHNHHNHHQQPPFAGMAEYQNAAPPPNGVHFQPPVPDTTFGPIPHVYVPRFDGGLHPGVQQPVVNPIAPQPYAHGTYVVSQQPCYVQQQQPVLGHQPVMVAGQPAFVAPPQPLAGIPTAGVAGGGGTGFTGGPPVIAGNSGHIPEVSGMGRTAGEEALRQIKFAHANRLYEPQDFKPSDDNPSRFYFVREVDGTWTQRNRFSIDHMGDCRWYVTDEGWFYAVRLPS